MRRRGIPVTLFTYCLLNGILWWWCCTWQSWSKGVFRQVYSVEHPNQSSIGDDTHRRVWFLSPLMSRNLCCSAARLHPSCICLGPDRDAAWSKVLEYRFQHIFHLHMSPYIDVAQSCATIYVVSPSTPFSPWSTMNLWNLELTACSRETNGLHRNKPGKQRRKLWVGVAYTLPNAKLPAICSDTEAFLAASTLVLAGTTRLHQAVYQHESPSPGSQTFIRNQWDARRGPKFLWRRCRALQATAWVPSTPCGGVTVTSVRGLPNLAGYQLWSRSQPNSRWYKI